MKTADNPHWGIISGADMGVITSAWNKYASFRHGVSRQNKSIVPTPIRIKNGAKEEDIPNAKDTAKRKLRGFADQVDLRPVEKTMSPNATATIVDVLFVAHNQVQTTDREGRGASTTIAELGATLGDDMRAGRPGEIAIYNTTGTARIADLVQYGGNIPDELVHAAWVEGLMALSPGFISLLSKPKKLFDLHRRGVVGPGIINPRSISAINWPDLVRETPRIARSVKKGQSEISLELQLGRHNSYYLSSESSPESAEQAARELEIVTRGVPPSLVPGIVGFYLRN